MNSPSQNSNILESVPCKSALKPAPLSEIEPKSSKNVKIDAEPKINNLSRKRTISESNTGDSLDSKKKNPTSSKLKK